MNTRHHYVKTTLERGDSAGGDGHTLIGLAVPFDVELEVYDWWDGDYLEVFRKGSFAKTIRENPGPPLLAHHDHREMPLGVATELVERSDGLHGIWRVSATPRGDEAVTLVGDGAISGLSIGFEPITDKTTHAKDRGAPMDLVERTEVRLREISLCNFPAYETAGVTGQRSRPPVGRPLAELAAYRAAQVDRFGRISR